MSATPGESSGDPNAGSNDAPGITDAPDSTDAAGNTDAAVDALPEAAARRTGYSTYTSGLSVQELAACEHMGLRPVGLVQGFCVMAWKFSYPGMGRPDHNGYRYPNKRIASYRCPHPYAYRSSTKHLGETYGWNYRATHLEAAWADGYNRAYRRMIEEAKKFRAHGVLGVTDATKSLVDAGVREFHLYGTAVVVGNARARKEIWSTYLAGQRLAKLFEAGLAPVSVIAAVGAVSIRPYCVTEALESGNYDPYLGPGAEIEQLSDAHTSARQVARDNLKKRLEGDELHGAELDVHEYRDFGPEIISAELRGTRVRRFREADPLPAPVPTIRMVG